MDELGFTGTETCGADAGQQINGQVVAAQTIGTTTTSELSASFAASTASACSIGTIGPCTVTTCPSPPSVVDAGIATPQAGTVSVSSETAMMSISPDPSMGQYTTIIDTTLLWQRGDRLTFSGKGGTVPPFTKSLCAPAPLQVTTPAASDSTRLTVDRSHDFTFVWSGSGIGEVTLGIPVEIPTQFVLLNCAYPASAGMGVIPSAALMQVSPGTHTFASSHVVRAVTVAGGACVEVEAAADNLNSIGGSLSFGLPATFR